MSVSPLLFDERTPPRTRPLVAAVEGAHAAKRPSYQVTGPHGAGNSAVRFSATRPRSPLIRGQAPSDHPAIAELLVRAGIDSLSLSSDVAVQTRLRIAELERAMGVTRGQEESH